MVMLAVLAWSATAAVARSDYSTAIGYTVTYMDLMPAGHVSGVIWAGAGAQQAGGDGYAGIWSGTRGSFIELTPPGYSSALVEGTTGAQQAGTVYDGTTSYAATWSGSAASFVSLAPPGAIASHASAAGGNQQAGDVTFSIDTYGNWLTHAAIWSGKRLRLRIFTRPERIGLSLTAPPAVGKSARLRSPPLLTPTTPRCGPALRALS